MSDNLHSSVQSLLADIITPTEERTIQTPTAVPIDSITMPLPESGTTAQAAAPVAETVVEEPKPELTAEVLSSSADLVIGMFDFSQHNLFRALGNRRKKGKVIRLYGEGAPDRLEHLLNEVDAYNNDRNHVQELKPLSTDDIGLLRLHKAAEEYLEGLQLTDYEKEALKGPLMEIMKKRGGTIPPEIALLLAVLQISGARAAELFLL